ncbi:hypothetical protein M2267_000655 [Ensifer sp. KUDG1]
MMLTTTLLAAILLSPLPLCHTAVAAAIKATKG